MGSGRRKLTAVAVSATKQPGYYGDGDGLYLQVSVTGTKSWVLRYMLNRRAREMGLGAVSTCTLAEARERAARYRKMAREGVDPIDYRDSERTKTALLTANRRTFEQCAHEYHELHASGWKNAKHAGQWISTLRTYVFPVFGKKDVSSVTKADIIKALEPIWVVKAETASRVRQRVRAVLDWAAARDYRREHDPHLWEQVSRSLPNAKDMKKPKHFEACPYLDVNMVIKAVHSSGAEAAVKDALEFLILTACRSGEVRGMRWAELDLESKQWTIPPERMKAGREHRVPLAARAIEILRARRSAASGEFVFANGKGKAYSDMTLTAVLRRLGFEFTVHGFRSTFRDWCADRTNFPREVCEAALAHANSDATEAAYFRSDLFEKRRHLMARWADFCASPAIRGTVRKLGNRGHA